jgi:hypothetical protein
MGVTLTSAIRILQKHLHELEPIVCKRVSGIGEEAVSCMILRQVVHHVLGRTGVVHVKVQAKAQVFLEDALCPQQHFPGAMPNAVHR